MNDKRRLIKSNRNLLIILSLISVLLTVYFMPASHKKNYIYTVGKPWTYDVLIAPFNFSIEKSDAVWQEESDSVRASFAPYFSRNAGIADNALAEFDRYYTDIICDSRRSSIFLPVKFLYGFGKCLIPSLDYNILLTSSTDVILSRKSELDAEGVRDINERIDYLAGHKGFYKVTNNGSPEECARKIISLIFDKQHEDICFRIRL